MAKCIGSLEEVSMVGWLVGWSGDGDNVKHLCLEMFANLPRISNPYCLLFS